MSELNTTAFVRPDGEYLTQQAPPRNSEGLIGWMQTNLFGNWTDRFVTVFVTLVFVWMAWSAVDDWFLSANLGGKTQAEGQMAEIISGVEEKFDTAARFERTWEDQAQDLVRNEDRNLENLAKDIQATDLQSLPTATRLGLEKRVVPSFIAEQITIAQSKLPLSTYARLAIIRREIEDPSVSVVEGLAEALRLTPAERSVLVEASRPWTTLSEEQKALFQTSARQIDAILKQTAKASDGKTKVLVPLDGLTADIDALVGSVNGEALLERPTRIALQFAGLVDGIVGTPMTNIPVSRIQKLRKDTLAPWKVDQVRQLAAEEIVAETDPDATGLRARRALEDAKNGLTDAQLFLNREMPFHLTDKNDPTSKERYPEAIENQGILDALDEMDFWAVSKTLAEPTGEALAASATEALTTAEKAPLVWQALADNFPDATPGPDDFAGATFALVNAYQNQDLEEMEAAWEHFEPLQKWAAGNDGSNWAVIGKNWKRMLWGTYPEERLWRVAAVALGLIVALLPILVPACRRLPFYIMTGTYPLFLLFMLGGLSIRFSGWEWPVDTNWFGLVYSDPGKVIQAVIALVVAIVAFVLQRTSLGKTAGPALVVAQALAVLYMVIMLWGTVINPKAAQQNVLVDNNFVGMLTADHPLGDELSPDRVQEQIDQLNAEAESGAFTPEESQAKRVQANELRPSLSAAKSAERDFNNVVKKGEGTFVILPFVKSGDWGGLLVTMVLGVLGMAASLPIGIVLAFGRQSTLPIVRWFSTGLIEITRGVPLIALLLIVTFVLPKLLPAGVDYPKLGLVFVAICLFGGVYQAEVVRGGLQSLPRGQYEAAQAMGLNFWQMSGLITLPQALKAVIPAIVNTFIGLFKDTTLVIVVGIFDFLTVAEAQITSKNAWNGTKPETLLVISLVFFVLMFSLSRYSMWLERRLATDHR